MEALGIPCCRALDFYKDRHVREILRYLRFISSPEDDQALKDAIVTMAGTALGMKVVAGLHDMDWNQCRLKPADTIHPDANYAQFSDKRGALVLETLYDIGHAYKNRFCSITSPSSIIEMVLARLAEAGRHRLAITSLRHMMPRSTKSSSCSCAPCGTEPIPDREPCPTAHKLAWLGCPWNSSVTFGCTLEHLPAFSRIAWTRMVERCPLATTRSDQACTWVMSTDSERREFR